MFDHDLTILSNITRALQKTLFLIPTVDSGGIENYLLCFLKTYKSQMDVTIIVRSDNSGDLYDEYKALDIPLLFMPLGYLKIGRWWKYYRFYKRNGFDTICDFNANMAGIPVWLAYLTGIKNRITFYRQGKDHFKTSFLKRTYNKLMNRMVYSYSTKILANSKSAINFFFSYRKQGDSKFKVINNGVDFNQFRKKINKTGLRQRLAIPANAFVIGHIGRLDKSKNHSTILKVASELIRCNQNIYLVLCGNGTEKLIDDVNILGISENVRLLGYRQDIPSLLQIFDLFYFPSITEGQPNALIEAMAAGVPVVASNIEPVKEIISDSSMLFNPFDTANVIKYIRVMIKDPSQASGCINMDELYRSFNAALRFDDFLKELENV